MRAWFRRFHNYLRRGPDTLRVLVITPNQAVRQSYLHRHEKVDFEFVADSEAPVKVRIRALGPESVQILVENGMAMPVTRHIRG